MKNKQLYLILKGYHAQLAAAIRAAENIVAEDMQPRMRPRHTVSHGPEPGPYAVFQSASKQLSEGLCKDQSHFTDIPDGFDHLQPLYDLAAELDEDIELMKSGKDEREGR
jgi:hypothetical protein